MNETPGEGGNANTHPLSLERINSICDRFEDAWLAAETEPELKDFLKDCPRTDRPTLFRHLLELDLDYRRRSSATLVLRDYIDQYPEFESIVRAAFDPDRIRQQNGDTSGDPLRTDSIGPSARTRLPHPVPQIPGYEILSELGRGGMGVVYKARHLELNRVVALKMIAGVDVFDQRAGTRFRIEAEAIARLQHPHIVQIFEIGEQANGTPYLALEFLSGGSLSDALDGSPWQVDPTVRLLEDLAETIDHAHKRQIVHRDLKPANILLARSSSGSDRETLQFKVTDFGLAKQLDAGKNATVEGDVLGTPAYMACEQVQGRISEIGPWTDVYALGVIGYELLTGRPPFRAESVVETIRQVLDSEPAPPRRQNPKCPRDLETIVLKCLEKDPGRRYATAAELAQDLRRFREHRPILARPAGTWELLGKWSRRNPSRAALVGLVALALLTAVVGVAMHLDRLRTERARAERNSGLAVRAVNEMLTEVAVEQLAYEPRMEKKRRALLDKARVLYETMLRDRPADPEVRHQLAIGFRHLGDVTRQLGDMEEAEEFYTQAIDRLSELLRESPDAELLFHLSETHNFLGEVHRLSGRPNQAQESYARAIELQQQLIVEQPEELLHRLHLGRSHDNRALAYRSEERLERARAESTEAVSHLRDLCASDTQAAHRHHLARARLNQGAILRQVGSADSAEMAYREASALLGELSEEHSLVPDYRHELALSLGNLGNLLARDPERRDKAKQAQQRSAELFRRLTREFPSIPIYRQELANTLNGLGVTLVRSGDRVKAQEKWEEAVAILRKLAAELPEVAEYHSRLGTTLGNVARLHLLQGEHAEARIRFEEAIGLVTSFLQVNPREPAYLGVWRSQHLALATTLMHLGEDEAAVRIAQRLPSSIPDMDGGRHLALCFLARCVGVRESLATPADRDRVVAPFLEAARELYEPLRKDPDAEARLRADKAFAPLAEEL